MKTNKFKGSWMPAILPAIFLLCAILGIMIFVKFTLSILTKTTGFSNKIILLFSDLIDSDEIVGIITGFIAIIIICVAVALATRKMAICAAEIAALALNAAPGAMTTMERSYTCGEISEEAFIARKDMLYNNLIFLGDMDGVGKFLAEGIKIMILVIAFGFLGGIIIGTKLHGQTIQEAAKTSIAFGLSGGIVFFLPLLLLSVAATIVSGRVYKSIR
jgi:flagellar biosynthesis protein FlhA